MSQPSDFDPFQPPPVQQPQEVDFGASPPPPPPAQGEPARPTTVYMPQAAAQPATPPSTFSPIAFLLGLIGSVVIAVAGMMPLIPADAGKDKEKHQMIMLAGQNEEGSKVFFNKYGPDYEIR